MEWPTYTASSPDSIANDWKPEGGLDVDSLLFLEVPYIEAHSG